MEIRKKFLPLMLRSLPRLPALVNPGDGWQGDYPDAAKSYHRGEQLNLNELQVKNP